MQYSGGKHRLAKPICEVILAHKGGRSVYIKPFLGGANSFAVIAPHFERRVGIELNGDIVALYRALQRGWDPPEHVSEEEYAQAKAGNVAPELRGFIGVACSFGGKWFGGYARGNTDAATGRRALQRQLPGLLGAELYADSYTKVNKLRSYEEAVIYCDPPYTGTTCGYVKQKFDHATFWSDAATWAQAGALVLVSERVAPEGWEPIWEHQTRQELRHGDRTQKATEYLFRAA